MQPAFFRRAFDQLDVVSSDGDSAIFMHLMYLGEMLTKVVGASLCAGILNDQDRHRYRQAYRLVHADSIGGWSQVIDEIAAGATSQFLCPELTVEKRELTQKVGHGTWQFEASAALDACLRVLQEDRPGLPAKLEGRSWFWYFTELRNSTRGHGALQPTVCSKISPLLESAIRKFIDHFSLFQREWAYLHRNLSGKFRVTKISESDDKFSPLKSKSSEAWGTLADGVYLFLDRPYKVELLYSDADLTDFFLPNGNFKSTSFETISYLTNSKSTEPSLAYIDPATQLPVSETQGMGSLMVTGEAFTNLPDRPKGYVSRSALETDVRDAIRDLERHPVVTLTGRGGIGKTSLALKVLHGELSGDTFGAILWFSSRDVDLLTSGAKPVRPHLLNEKDMGKECKALLAELITVDEDEKGIDFFSKALFKSPIDAPILFVFDNFETVTSPVELYKWIDTYIRVPNKVLITTRFREFKADYAIEIGGMEEPEALTLISETAKSLTIAHLVTDGIAQELYKESDGHPYIIKILLGEIARVGKVEHIERVVASKDNILDALFERSYARLSPAAQQVFLTLCSWRSTIPKIALEAVLLRPINEKMDVDAAVDELEQSSFIEIAADNDEREPFIVVPLSAAIFGRKRLQASPWKLSVEANMQLLLLFGAGQRAEISKGVGPRVEKFFRRVASEVAGSKTTIEQYLPMLEYLSRRYSRGWLLLAELYEERGGADSLQEAGSAYRRFIESVQDRTPERALGWRNLARVSRLRNDLAAELQALSELALFPDADFTVISDAINRFNQSGKQSSDFATDEKRLLGSRLLSIAEAKIAEADATDLSRVAWLCISQGLDDRAKDLTIAGLKMEPDNDYCLRLAERRGWL